MNAIRRNQADTRTDRAARKLLTAEISRFAGYLASSKFQGPCEDHVTTWEVLQHHARLLAILTLAEDHKQRRRQGGAQ